MITGKGRCNFTNVKTWSDFSVHVRANGQFARPAFHAFPPQRLIDFFEQYGMASVVERGDRAFPESHRSSDVIDTLVSACHGVGVKIETDSEVISVTAVADQLPSRWRVQTADGREYLAGAVILATGGLSYQSTGSTGDGLKWAESLGHKIVPVFPSLTALVPKGYKDTTNKGHIDRETPLSELGRKLCGISLKNVQASLEVGGASSDSEFGDIDFTDGGIEGPIGFQLSRKAVKAMTNGAKAALELDLKPGVSLTEVTERVKTLWQEVDKDRRSAGLHEKEKCRIMLGKLMPWDLIPAFTAMNPDIITLERKGRTATKVWINLPSIAAALKHWRFDLAGYVGWERAVVTAGGVDTAGVVAKTMASRLHDGLFFCGEMLDLDCDTGGYNLQTAFSTGWLAGESAAKFLK